MIFSKLRRKTKKKQEPISLFTTNRKEKVLLEPLKPGVVTIYSCGPTVYDFPHIGNYRPYVISDILVRTLTNAGYGVTHAINITDVGHLVGDGDEGEDKMELGAQKRGKTVPQIALEVEECFKRELKELNIITDKTLFPKATEHIKEQIAFIETLEQKGYTYKISDGIYFDTARFPEYGRLGNRDIEQQQEGARVEVNPEKHSGADFALWKFSPEGETRQQEWDSPWGKGFPGWHIECSAMATKHLGKTIDIHTGGVDHIATHHNNEIAQSEVVTGKQFVRNWLHVEHISIEGNKISKSVGNTVYLRNLIERDISPLSFRYWLLSGHYRTRMNFTWEAVKGAHTALFKIHKYFTEHLLKVQSDTEDATYTKAIRDALRDDLDTPKAIALIWEIIKDDKLTPGKKKATLLVADSLLGLDMQGRDSLFNQKNNVKISVNSLPSDIQDIIQKRDTARKNHEWEVSDTLRDELTKKGYTVIDTKEGTTVEISSQNPQHEEGR